VADGVGDLRAGHAVGPLRDLDAAQQLRGIEVRIVAGARVRDFAPDGAEAPLDVLLDRAAQRVAHAVVDLRQLLQRIKEHVV
jgi:hypothetical protein